MVLLHTLRTMFEAQAIGCTLPLSSSHRDGVATKIILAPWLLWCSTDTEPLTKSSSSSLACEASVITRLIRPPGLLQSSKPDLKGNAPLIGLDRILHGLVRLLDVSYSALVVDADWIRETLYERSGRHCRHTQASEPATDFICVLSESVKGSPGRRRGAIGIFLIVRVVSPQVMWIL